MNLRTLLFFCVSLLTFSVASSSIKSGDFVKISGIESVPSLNGCIGLVLEADPSKPERKNVLILKTDTSFASPQIKKNSIKTSNLSALQWNLPVELSLEQIFRNIQKIGVNSGFESVTLSQDQKAILDKSFNFLQNLCNRTPSKFITDADIKLKARLIGAWINIHSSQAGMVYVAEKSREMLPFLERVWGGIGSWLA